MVPSMAGFALRKLVEMNVSELIFDDAGQLYERHQKTFDKVFDAVGNAKIRLLVMLKYMGQLEGHLLEAIDAMFYRPPKTTAYINMLKAKSWPWVPLPDFSFYYVNGEEAHVVDSRLELIANCVTLDPRTCARCATKFTPYEPCRCGVCVRA